VSKVADVTIQRSKAILKTLARHSFCWSDLERKVIDVCPTHSVFARTMQFLLRNGLIKKTGRKGQRTPYRITEKGRKQLEIWQSS